MSTRAREPDRTGFVERPGGVRVAWELFGVGDPAILFVPTWAIVTSRAWKLQVPDFARRNRVLTLDPRGNGHTDRPASPEAYAEKEYAGDIVAVLDATGTDRAVLVSLSRGAQRSLIVAAEHPERVAGLVVIGPALALGGPAPARASVSFDAELPDEGWNRYNRHSWRRDYPGFLQFFFGQCFPEPHSTKPIEDCVGWGLETDPETLIATHLATGLGGRDETVALASRVRCPVLVIHGDRDGIRPHAHGRELAEVTGGQFVTLAGGGHIPLARDPIRVNLLIRDFVRSAGTRTPSVEAEVRHASQVA